jgi:signal transduction histidine kinase
MLGATFQEAILKLNTLLGVAGRVRQPGSASGLSSAEADWQDGSMHLRAVDRSGEHIVGLVLEDKNTLRNLSSLRANKAADPFAIDPSIAAITSKGVSDPNAAHARADARVHQAARDAVARSLVEHTARGERARIARELHNVVAHHISMVAVQAESARLTTPGMPPAGAARLLDIGDTARAALTEMRRLLGVLREDAAVEIADRRPQPGLAQLTTLLDESRAASGGGVRLIVSGLIAPLDPGVELAAYRIVQEALTNARRHAPGAAVDVELRYTDDALWLRIRDNGPGPSAAAAGHGLLGMRERAVAAGGSLRCGAAVGGGFLIEATLPGKAET